MLPINNEYKSIREIYFEKISKYTKGYYKKIAIRVIHDIVNAETKKKSATHSVEIYLDQALDFLRTYEKLIKTEGFCSSLIR